MADYQILGYMSHWVERVTKGLRNISTDHGAIHKGQGFTISITDMSLAVGASYYLSILTPADKYLHFKSIKVIDSKAAIYKGAPAATGGTAVTIYNQNDVLNGNSLYATGTTVKRGVAVSLAGLSPIRGWQGETITPDQEVVLDKNTEYIIHIVNIKGAQNDAYFEAFYYEEDNYHG